MHVDFQQLGITMTKIITGYGLNLLWAVIIIILGRMVASLLKKGTTRALQKSRIDETITSFTANLAYVIVLVFTLISALGQLGIQTGSFIAILGAAGLAIALAFQGSLSNLAAGILMLIFRPFKIGDYIQGAGVGGTVKEIQVLNTVLLTVDNTRVIVPNSKLLNDNITNYSAEDRRRINLTVGISYDDSIQNARDVILDILSSYPEILSDPAPLVAVANLGESCVELTVRPWVKAADYWPVKFRLNEDIKLRFDQEKITLPFPQRDVHLFPATE
ncbi:MAG: mechanosensitive ion channel family protein [Fidelibacterota bacterium]